MRQSCPWSFWAAIALTVLTGIVLALKIASGDITSTIISGTLIVATPSTWLWCGFHHLIIRSEAARFRVEMEQLDHELRSR